MIGQNRTPKYCFITQQQKEEKELAVTLRTSISTMTSLISFLRFMLLLTTTSAQSPIYMYNFCQNTTRKSLTTSYQTNLNNLFSWILSDSATSKGYNHTTINNGGQNDAVYGVYECRRDITGYLCQFCLNTAVREMVQRCPNSVSAVVWYDVCIVRYSNHSFYNDLSISPIWNVTGSENLKDSTEAVKVEDAMQGLIRKATVESNQSWAMSEFNWGGNEKRYGLVQCARDLTSDQCRQCLEAVLNKVPECCGTKVAWVVMAPSCGTKFDHHMFSSQFSNQTTSPSPLPNPAKQEGTSNSKTKTLIITIVSVLVAAVLISYCVYNSRRRIGLSKDGLQLDTIPIAFQVQGDDSMNSDLPTIPLIVIQQTTNNFSESSKLGEGGFGPVYKGTLPDGTEIAVKRLSETSDQGSEEFKNEVIFIAKLQHRNLVRLLGCCIEENEKLLVYEFMPNSSLDFHLFNEAKQKQLDWKLRLNIINGIARGMLYLHEDSRLRVIHRDLKASNVLLDDDMNPKISDFGLARTFVKGQSQTKTKRVVGTYGYMAPEYAMAGLFSVKSDVFSFGVLLLEIIYGKRNGDFHLSEYGQSLLVYAWRLWCEGKSLELINPLEENTCIESEVLKCIHIGLLCVQEDAADRPIMSTVVLMLGSDTMALPKPKQPAFSIGRMSNEESLSKNSKDNSVNEVTVTTMAPR